MGLNLRGAHGSRPRGVRVFGVRRHGVAEEINSKRVLARGGRENLAGERASPLFFDFALDGPFFHRVPGDFFRSGGWREFGSELLGD